MSNLKQEYANNSPHVAKFTDMRALVKFIWRWDITNENCEALGDVKENCVYIKIPFVNSRKRI